jgi:hypothetical protein
MNEVQPLTLEFSYKESRDNSVGKVTSLRAGQSGF